MSQQVMQCKCGHIFGSMKWIPCPKCKSRETYLKPIFDMKQGLAFHEILCSIRLIKEKYNLPLNEIIAAIQDEVVK